MEKSKWAKSSNGPDMTDIESLMRALSGLHSARVELKFSPIGIGSSGGVSISATANFERLPGSSLPAIVETEEKWPNSQGLDFFGQLFNLLYQLDWRISQVYQSEELWK